MSSSSLLALSPLDGRYSNHIEPLTHYFSEFALIRYRVKVEVEYLIQLSALNLKNCPPLPEMSTEKLRLLVENFTHEQAEEVKSIEKTINHDVKAVEYFLKQQLENLDLGAWMEFVHFGLTSQDINNTAIPLSLHDCYLALIRPTINGLVNRLKSIAETWKDIPMLARTHGQPATPVRLGKEMMVFVERLEVQLSLLDSVPFKAKFGGATGGFNAHLIAYPSVDWVQFGNRFVENLGLQRSRFTTQIEHYDCMAAFFDGLSRIHTILIDLCRDVWQYISLDYFKQKINAGEVGSSAMPHKVNPIDFENAEGNLGIANALFHHFSTKLPISRLQRDLSDSTVLRNVGVPLGHCLVAFQSINKGLNKIEVNEAWIRADLADHVEVLSEAIQTILRREGYPKPYEALKNLSRKGERLSMSDLSQFIDQLEVRYEIKHELHTLRVENYIGVGF